MRWLVGLRKGLQPLQALYNWSEDMEPSGAAPYMFEPESEESDAEEEQPAVAQRLEMNVSDW